MIDQHVKTLKARQRAAINIGLDADHRCPACRKSGGMLYYTLDADVTIRERDGQKRVDVGWFCGWCKWGNAGALSLERFKPVVDVMLPEE